MENEEDSLEEINKKERKIKRGLSLGIAIYWRKEMHCACYALLPSQLSNMVV